MGKIHTISELLEEIIEFKSVVPNEQIYYRGQNNGTNAGYLINNELEKFYNEELEEKKILNPMVLVNGCVLSERIRNQKGDFILYFEEGDINDNRSFTIKEFQICTDSIERLKEELNLLGISESTIYPSLATETHTLKKQLQNNARQRDMKEKIKASISKGLPDTKQVVSNVIGEKIASRKFLDKKKMFAEIDIKK